MLARILSIIGLQGFAVLTAMLHQHLGVHTDEAKYLLNIPYPHPPLLRWIMGLSDGWQHQELFWRILFASFIAHGVWLVADMVRTFSREQRLTIVGLWLFSGALLLQSGTLMMSCITAVQALFLLWMLSRPKFLRKWSVIVAALWIEMLFTAYQGILFAPLVWIALQRSDLGFWKRMFSFFTPIALLLLYTLGNPLAIAAMGFVGSMQSGVSLEQSILSVLKIWMIGGSIVLSVLGIFGMVRSRNIPLILTTVLLTAYILLSSRGYYAILFTPVLIAGITSQPKFLRSSSILAAHIVAGIALFFYVPFSTRSAAPTVAAALERVHSEGTVLISGDFGHDWQYELRRPVRRYKKEFLEDASAVVCIAPCTEIDARSWRQVPQVGAEVWVRTGR
ncbi:MAG: hypothetical protein Greene101449_153 [Candidatus Peregrinibacteria bacterium Greene1014_49]|nr:MAG: hypothetical protein Greene101449_153 [Candidatus Peregrinibacteria bacterium Greene1014_49]